MTICWRITSVRSPRSVASPLPHLPHLPDAVASSVPSQSEGEDVGRVTGDEAARLARFISRHLENSWFQHSANELKAQVQQMRRGVQVRTTAGRFVYRGLMFCDQLRVEYSHTPLCHCVRRVRRSRLRTGIALASLLSERAPPPLSGPAAGEPCPLKTTHSRTGTTVASLLSERALPPPSEQE